MIDIDRSKNTVIVSETSFPIRHLAVCSCGKRAIVVQESHDKPMTSSEGWIVMIQPVTGFACGKIGHYPWSFKEI